MNHDFTFKLSVHYVNEIYRNFSQPGRALFSQAKAFGLSCTGVAPPQPCIAATKDTETIINSVKAQDVSLTTYRTHQFEWTTPKCQSVVQESDQALTTMPPCQTSVLR